MEGRVQPKKRMPLPKWAKVVEPLSGSVGKDPVPLPQEEQYLRTKCVHILSRQMDRAWQESLEKLGTTPVLEELSRMMDQVKQPDQNSGAIDVGGTSAAAASQTFSSSRTTSTAGMSMTSMEEPRRYNPLLLPVLLIKGPCQALDRQEWMKQLVLATKKSSHRKLKRSCVVWLRVANTAGLVTTRQEECVRQCLLQEPSSEVLAIVKGKKRGGDCASLTDVLVSWASNTQSFDDIVVFVETVVGWDEPALQVFVEWLAERRALQGLPFTLVMMEPPLSGPSSMQIRSFMQGPVGLLVRNVFLASATQVLDEFWERLWIDLKFPLLFSSSILENSIGQSYREENGSAVQVVLKLKQTLAHFLLASGSFLVAAAGNRDLFHEEQSRISWFCFDKEARALILKNSTSKLDIKKWMNDMNRRRREATIVMQIQKLLKDLEDKTDVPFLLRPSNQSLPKPCRQVAKEVMPFLAKLRRRNRQHNRVFNKLIVVLGNCTYTSDFEFCLRDIIHGWRKLLLLHHDPLQYEMDAFETLSMQPRRQTVAGLIEEIDCVDNLDGSSLCTANLAGCLYNMILQDLVSISREEWFSLFRERFAAHLTLQEACSLFAGGICYLKIAGLIREKRSTSIVKDKSVCVKSVLVWCSGD